MNRRVLCFSIHSQYIPTPHFAAELFRGPADKVHKVTTYHRSSQSFLLYRKYFCNNCETKRIPITAWTDSSNRSIKFSLSPTIMMPVAYNGEHKQFQRPPSFFHSMAASPPASDGNNSSSAKRNDPNGLRYESRGLLNPKNSKNTSIGAFIASVLVAVGHHIPLSNLDGHTIEYSNSGLECFLGRGRIPIRSRSYSPRGHVLIARICHTADFLFRYGERPPLFPSHRNSG
jgi:hypothetical protein